MAARVPQRSFEGRRKNFQPAFFHAFFGGLSSLFPIEIAQHANLIISGGFARTLHLSNDRNQETTSNRYAIEVKILDSLGKFSIISRMLWKIPTHNARDSEINRIHARIVVNESRKWKSLEAIATHRFSPLSKFLRTTRAIKLDFHLPSALMRPYHSLY